MARVMKVPMGQLPDHIKGLSIATLGVLVLTPDSMLVRLIGLDSWSMVFWRGLLNMLVLTLALIVTYRGRTLALFLAIGRSGLAITALFSTGSVLFILALHNTSVANTLVIVAATPLITAILSWLFLAEPVPRRTWLAILAAFAGIAILVSDSPRGGTLAGDLAALGTAACLAAAMALIRRAKALNMVPAMALSGGVSALVMLPFAAPLSVAPGEVWLLLVLGVVVLPVSFGLTTLGLRYLPAPEVALILLLETVLGPFWVWLVLNETPSTRALIGGGVVVAALILHSLATLLRPRGHAQRALGGQRP
jgi:drug/metabolite transporter (DMT)-like permease